MDFWFSWEMPLKETSCQFNSEVEKLYLWWECALFETRNPLNPASLAQCSDECCVIFSTILVLVQPLWNLKTSLMMGSGTQYSCPGSERTVCSRWTASQVRIRSVKEAHTWKIVRNCHHACGNSGSLPNIRGLVTVQCTSLVQIQDHLATLNSGRQFLTKVIKREGKQFCRLKSKDNSSPQNVNHCLCHCVQFLQPWSELFCVFNRKHWSIARKYGRIVYNQRNLSRWCQGR